MKDKHNVILILVSSKRLILYSRGSSNSWFPLFIFSSSRSSNLFQLFYHGDPSKSLQGFTLCFQPFFLSVWSFFCLTEFFMETLTWWFIKDLIPSQSVHWDSFQRSSSILHLTIRSAILFFHIIVVGIMSFLIIWVHVSWFTGC